MKLKNVFRILFIASGAIALYCIAQEKYRSDLRERLGAELGDLEPSKKEGAAGLPNPVRRLSAAELNAASGIGLNADELTGSHPRFYSIKTDPVLYGVELEDSDCFRYDFRFCSKSFDGDISGMHYEWTEKDLYPQDSPACEVFLNETGQGVCRWEDEERKYTISMTEEASLVKLVWMRQKLCSLMI